MDEVNGEAVLLTGSRDGALSAGDGALGAGEGARLCLTIGEGALACA